LAPKPAAAPAPKPKPAPRTTPKHVCDYDYTDLAGNLLYQVQRFEPKTFRQRRPDGNGGWVYVKVFEGVSRVPYHWPDLARELAEYPDAPVFYCEGEKDTDNVRKLGLIATTCAGNVMTAEIAAIFKDRDIIVLADNDAKGRELANRAALTLAGSARTVRIAGFEDLPEKSDVTDWITADPIKHDADALVERCRHAPLFDAKAAREPADPKSGELPTLTLDQWAERELPPPDFLLGSWLTTTSKVLLAAPTGIGKTNFGLGIAMRCAAGCGFLHWQGRRAARVLYVDGEMSRRLLKERLAYEETRLGSRPDGFFALSREDVEGFQPLNSPEGQAWMLAFIKKIGGVDLALFDNVMSLIMGSMIEEEPWAQTMPLVRTLTQNNIGQIWMHHTGHDESKSYGTKTREWLLDSVIHLEPVNDDGADISFMLSFPKARERTPATRLDFQNVRVSLIGDEWRHELTEQRRQGRASPMAMKFLDALTNVLAGGQAVSMFGGRKAARYEHWQLECAHLGLLDMAKPDNARALLSKYRRELVAADRIACAGDLAWRL
jgi:hypothetical protein